MRNLITQFVSRLRAFGRSESGMTLPLLAISMVTITGMTGIAIDVARAQLVQSKLQFSLDAAGLAGTSTVSTSALTTEVNKYLDANFNGYLGSTVTATNVSANNSNTVFSLSATATLPTTFLNVVGEKTISVNAATEITRAVSGLELVLVLDNTGSMQNSAGGSVSKIDALKSAATTLINTLYGSNDSVKDLYVGVVPFSQAVNIGTSHSSWMDATYDATLTDWGPSPSAWAGCVDARFNNSEDQVDDPPSQSNTNTLFRQYFWPSSTYNNWKSCSVQYKKCVTAYNRCKNGSCVVSSPTCSTSNGHTCTQIADSCSTTTSCTTSSTTTCTNLGNVCTYSSPLNTTSRGPNYLCPQEVTPMTTSKTTVLSAISTMVAQGNTEINQGMFWGWNMISPRWRGYWGGTMDSNHLPLDYHTPHMNKAIVMLTDGINTIDNTSHGSYWYLSDGKLGTTSSTTAVTTMDDRTRSICTAMKNQGVYIYTIALGTDTTSASLQLLEDCATSSNYYFNSPNTDQLQTVFSAIGDSLSNLRVSK